MTLAPLLALALAAPPAAPEPLAALRAAVCGLGARAPVRARVEHRYGVRAGDDPPRPEGLVELEAADGPDGLQVTFGQAMLAEAAREEQRRADEPEALTPVRDTFGDLRALTLARQLDAGAELCRTLQQAELVEAGPGELDGAPARLVVLKVKPFLATRDRRYVRELTATARLWLGTDGLPLAEEQRALAKGRAFLVVTFETEQVERLRFARVGDRLVLVRHEVEQRSHGAGERSARHALTTLTLLP